MLVKLARYAGAQLATATTVAPTDTPSGTAPGSATPTTAGQPVSLDADQFGALIIALGLIVFLLAVMMLVSWRRA